MTAERGQELEANITLEEVAKALEMLSQSKATGSNGFPTEYYKTFAPMVKQKLLETFNGARDRGILPLSMREGQIALILKTGQKVWTHRPIDPLQ